MDLTKNLLKVFTANFTALAVSIAITSFFSLYRNSPSLQICRSAATSGKYQYLVSYSNSPIDESYLRKRALDFSWKNIVEKEIEVYNEVLNKFGGSNA